MANMLLGMATNVLEWTGFILQWTVSKLRLTVIRLSIILGILTFLLWLSFLLFISFYWLYMPSSSHVKQVHFDFNVCDDGVGMCSFPTANVTFGKDGTREEILRASQVYRILIELEVPESPVNQQIGMFMVKLKMYDKNSQVTAQSSRSAVLHYQSMLLRIIKTIVFAPVLLSGAAEEKQILEVEMFPSYIDAYNNPSVGAIIEIQSKKVEIYTAKVNIYAYFTGLRFYLFYWPMASAVIGVFCNFMFFCVIALLSYYKYYLQEEEDIEFDPALLNRRYSLFDRRVRIQAQLNKERDEAEASDESETENNEDLSEADRMNIMPETIGITVTGSEGDIQDDSIAVMSPPGDETVIKTADVTLLTATNARLRQRRPSQQVTFDLPPN